MPSKRRDSETHRTTLVVGSEDIDLYARTLRDFIPEDAVGDLELQEAEGAEVKGGDGYNAWRDNFGQTAAPAGNGNGVVDAADYVVWRKAYP